MHVVQRSGSYKEHSLVFYNLHLYTNDTIRRMLKCTLQYNITYYYSNTLICSRISFLFSGLPILILYRQCSTTAFSSSAVNIFARVPIRGLRTRSDKVELGISKYRAAALKVMRPWRTSVIARRKRSALYCFSLVAAGSKRFKRYRLFENMYRFYIWNPSGIWKVLKKPQNENLLFKLFINTHKEWLVCFVNAQ